MKMTLNFAVLVSVLHAQHVLSSPVGSPAQQDQRIAAREPITPQQFGQIIALNDQLISAAAQGVKSIFQLAPPGSGGASPAGSSPASLVSAISGGSANSNGNSITQRDSEFNFPNVRLALASASAQAINEAIQEVQSFVRPIKSMALAPFAALFPGSGSQSQGAGTGGAIASAGADAIPTSIPTGALGSLSPTSIPTSIPTGALGSLLPTSVPTSIPTGALGSILPTSTARSTGIAL
ncbi:hypothetical protein CPC08DRAFT_763446 [Agrocybe pediades]|nr:hypothetical protein CPC08DRAFT_763446 [Agrocybe pediades]